MRIDQIFPLNDADCSAQSYPFWSHNRHLYLSFALGRMKCFAAQSLMALRQHRSLDDKGLSRFEQKVEVNISKCKENNSGPRSKPCGTHVGEESDTKSPTEVVKHLFVKQDENQSNAMPSMATQSHSLL